jgi:hypothetical protein
LKKSKFGGQLRAKMKKFKTNDLFVKDAWIQEPNPIESSGEIIEIRSLNDN